mmetsp:Transcript_79810/g.138472  ORF Transcript_79810/g.138472 Transcript_79810/m.138472 type:complete len:226 (+) Transcript_79810:256-933(+)
MPKRLRKGLKMSKKRMLKMMPKMGSRAKTKRMRMSLMMLQWRKRRSPRKMNSCQSVQNISLARCARAVSRPVISVKPNNHAAICAPRIENASFSTLDMINVAFVQVVVAQNLILLTVSIRSGCSHSRSRTQIAKRSFLRNQRGQPGDAKGMPQRMVTASLRSRRKNADAGRNAQIQKKPTGGKSIKCGRCCVGNHKQSKDRQSIRYCTMRDSMIPLVCKATVLSC